MKVGITIPCGTCTGCGRAIARGETAEVVVRAGSAWNDGAAELVDGAEMFTATVLCPKCSAVEGGTT